MLRMVTRQSMDDGACTSVRWHHARMRVYAMRSHGIVFDSLPFARHSSLMPPLIDHVLTCVLHGELISRRGGSEREVRADRALLEPTMAWNERWMGPRFEALVIDWDPKLLPVRSTTVLVLDADSRAEAAALFERILAPDDREEEGRQVFGAASDLVAHLGIGRFSPDPRDAPELFASSPQDRATARWVSALRSDVPAASFKRATDLTGLSERQLRRQFEQMARRAGMPVNFRTILVADRLVAAVRLLGGASPIGEVAKASGYGSSRALGLALDQAGLPTATEIRRLAHRR